MCLLGKYEVSQTFSVQLPGVQPSSAGPDEGYRNETNNYVGYYDFNGNAGAIPTEQNTCITLLLPDCYTNNK